MSLRFIKSGTLALAIFAYVGGAYARYIQADPIGLDGGINSYSYVGGSPLVNADPLGLCKVEARFWQYGLAFHSFIVTTDTDGSQNYYGAYPTGGLIGGTLTAEGGAYKPGTRNWTTKQLPSKVYLDDGKPCACDSGFGQAVNNINNSNIPYGLLSTNSNAATTYMLQQGGFTPGDSPIPGRIPGWNTPLPTVNGR
jgi:hypothetical protein